MVYSCPSWTMGISIDLLVPLDEIGSLVPSCCTESYYKLSIHCNLYAAVRLPSLRASRLQHWYFFIHKAILGDILPSSKFDLVRNGLNLYSIKCLDTVCNIFFRGGGQKKYFFGPWSWNDLQTNLKKASLIILRRFKGIIVDDDT